MSMTELAALDAACQARLEADPYERDALLLDFLFAVAADDKQRVGPALKRLQSLALGRSVVLAVSRAVASGAVFHGQVLAGGTPLFVVRQGGVEEAPLIGWIAATLSALQAALACALPALVVVVGQDEGNGAQCLNESPALALLRIGAAVSDDDAPALLAHELTHAVLRSGNRILDEGLALSFEKRLAPESALRLARAAHAGWLRQGAAAGLSLRAAMAADLRADPYLRSLAPVVPPGVLYAYGLTLAEAIQARLGALALPGLCQAVAVEARPAAQPAALEAALGCTLESLEAGPVQSIDPSVDAARQALRMQDAAGPQLQLAEALISTILRAHRLGSERPPRWIYAEARSLHESLLRRGNGEPMGMRLTAARLELCALLESEPGIDPTVQAVRCYRLFERLLLEWPEAPAVLLNAARYFIGLPREQGGSPERAHACLLTLQRVAPALAAELAAEWPAGAVCSPDPLAED